MTNPHSLLGLGLRSQHFDDIVQHRPDVGWFEIISENFMDSGGRPRQVLRQLLNHYPFAMHGVSLSIGSTDPLDLSYLNKLKLLAGEVQPMLISDHLCWTGVMQLNSHDLLPLPLNRTCLEHLVPRIHKVQEVLQRPLVLENPSTYLQFRDSDMPEWLFFQELVQRTGCGMLLDVNNVYVSAFNNGFDPVTYLRNLPHEAVKQLHLARHLHCQDHIIDTHDQPVSQAVWPLFQLAWQLTGGVATCLEWDGNIPDLATCLAELHKAQDFMQPLAADWQWQDVPPTPQYRPDAVGTPIDFIVTDPDAEGEMQLEPVHE